MATDTTVVAEWRCSLTKAGLVPIGTCDTHTCPQVGPLIARLVADQHERYFTYHCERCGKHVRPITWVPAWAAAGPD